MRVSYTLLQFTTTLSRGRRRDYVIKPIKSVITHSFDTGIDWKRFPFYPPVLAVAAFLRIFLRIQFILKLCDFKMLSFHSSHSCVAIVNYFCAIF